MKNLLFCLLVSGLFIVPSWTSATYSAAASPDNEIEDGAKAICMDVYEFTMALTVPQVFDNSLSTGYRKYKHQKIKGYLYIKWFADGTYKILMDGLYNNNFKVGGVKVAYTEYDANIIFPRFNWIGSNKTGAFTVPTLCFSIALEPSYAISEANEDNAFYLTLSGKGISANKKSLGCRVATKIRGYATGTQGCGCSDYGHKSPTRRGSACGPSESVDDVVATFGHWSAKWVRRCNCG